MIRLDRNDLRLPLNALLIELFLIPVKIRKFQVGRYSTQSNNADLFIPPPPPHRISGEEIISTPSTHFLPVDGRGGHRKAVNHAVRYRGHPGDLQPVARTFASVPPSSIHIYGLFASYCRDEGKMRSPSRFFKFQQRQNGNVAKILNIILI